MGTKTVILTDKIHQPTLADAQKWVGGYIEIVVTDNGDQIVLNEEGKLHKLPYNAIATEFAHQGHAIAVDDYIVGDVMILQGEARLD